LIDFDATIHRYSKGWHDGTAYDDPMPGAQEALAELERRGYEVVIFSTRPAEQITPWLKAHGFPAYPVTNVKLPATAIIDDRAIHHVDWSGSLSELARRYPPSSHGVVGSTHTPGSPGRKELS
jgi:predicted glycosyltransferase